MGQKCSCLIKEDEDISEKKLEDESENRINITKSHSIKDNNKNESFIRSKFNANLESKNNLSQRDKQNSNSLEANNYLKTDNSLNNAKTNLQEKQTLERKVTKKEIDVDKVNLIIKNISNWFYKKRFVENLKEELEKANEHLFSNLINSENVKNLEALAKQCKKPFRIDDWKNYYKEFPINLSSLYSADKNVDKASIQSGVNFDYVFGKTYKSKKIFLGKNSDKQASNKDNIRMINKDNISNANDTSKDNLIEANKDKYNNANDSQNEISNKNNKKKIKELKNYVYKGDVNKYNQKHGKGVLYYLDGSSKEEGTWYEDELIGWIRIIFSGGNGLVIDGMYQNRAFNGKGKIYSLDESTVYEGDLTNSKKQGFGIEITPEQKYEGEFFENKKNGKGQISFIKSGDTFEGEFKDNKMFYGKYTWSDNGNVYEGSFLNNKMHGKGKYIWKDNGNIYEGEYKEGKKHGFGIIKENDKIVYEGEFLDGHPHGKGVRYDKKGTKMEVTMDHGKKVKDAVERQISLSPKKIGLSIF